MIIPPDRLQPPVLQALLEEFITREGTDYGVQEVALAVKVEEIKAQLETGEAVIVFDTATESTQIMTRQAYGLMAHPPSS
ncbi:MAG: YheU family protein [Cellvibrionaceae bacterium]|nr:YheU family protein [Cellvibrionaceae bacterium]